MTWHLAPCLRVLRAEVNALYPERDKTSDGTVGDLAHRKRSSDHNPDDNGVVRAWDCDKDGVPLDDIVEIVRRRGKAADPRLSGGYIIWKDRIAGTHTGWAWAAYQPHNPKRNRHDAHAHFSCADTRYGYDDARPWALAEHLRARPGPVKTLPAPAPLEDDMPVLARIKGEKTVWLTDLLHARRSLDDAAEVAALKAAGVRDVGEVPADLLADVPVLRG